MSDLEGVVEHWKEKCEKQLEHAQTETRISVPAIQLLDIIAKAEPNEAALDEAVKLREANAQLTADLEAADARATAAAEEAAKWKAAWEELNARPVGPGNTTAEVIPPPAAPPDVPVAVENPADVPEAAPVSPNPNPALAHLSEPEQPPAPEPSEPASVPGATSEPAPEPAADPPSSVNP